MQQVKTINNTKTIMKTQHNIYDRRSETFVSDVISWYQPYNSSAQKQSTNMKMSMVV